MGRRVSETCSEKSLEAPATGRQMGGFNLAFGSAAESVAAGVGAAARLPERASPSSPGGGGKGLELTYWRRRRRRRRVVAKVLRPTAAILPCPATFVFMVAVWARGIKAYGVGHAGTQVPRLAARGCQP